MIIIRLLNKMPKKALKIWKEQTDLFLLELKHKIDLKEITLKRKQVLTLGNLKMIN